MIEKEETPMTETPNPAADPVREQADAIVAQGQDVRSRIARLVTQTAEKFSLTRDGLIGTARSILEGATAAVDRAVPPDPDSTLRQVVDGLGDGLSAAAGAVQAAFEEAKAQGKTFASEDLTTLRGNLKTASDLFVDTVSTTAGRFRSLAAGQLTSLRTHAEKARERALPALESALSAAREHPLRLTTESAEAGFTASRQALGALFSAVGRRLQEAGQRLKGGDQPS
jgi:hypothetical protein